MEQEALTVRLGRPNSAPQRAFFAARQKYICYGGARGGGKSWALRTKAVGGALRWPGIRILILRRTYPDLENTLIEPMLAQLPPGLAEYNRAMHRLLFFNGSSIRFGHLPGYGAAVGGEYQGQEYDWIFLDEATQFLESEFRAMAACLRGVLPIPRRFYLTCNPGGIGHAWVKRLFLDRRFDPGEDPADYVFFKATVEDNRDLMRASPDYAAALELLPPDVRRAHRYGDWDALSGAFFPEFRPALHVCTAFALPAHWPRYRAFDYGLDMFACLWIAVDEQGGCWVYRELARPGLIVSAAADAMLAAETPGEQISLTLAPPDLWSRQKDSGKTMAELFRQHGVGLVKASSSRIHGWMQVKELLRTDRGGQPRLRIFAGCSGLITQLPLLQHDPNDPSDCATVPHEITHLPDALRYFCVSRTLAAEPPETCEEEEPQEQTPAAAYLWR